MLGKSYSAGGGVGFMTCCAAGVWDIGLSYGFIPYEEPPVAGLDVEVRLTAIYLPRSSFSTVLLNILSTFFWASFAFFSSSSLLIMRTTDIIMNDQGFIHWG